MSTGDNAEVSSIARVFTNAGARDNELFIGSVKGNIGHLEATSGMSGLIKSVLILKHGMIPPNIDLETPKKNLRLKERKLKVWLRLAYSVNADNFFYRSSKSLLHCLGRGRNGFP